MLDLGTGAVESGRMAELISIIGIDLTGQQASIELTASTHTWTAPGPIRGSRRSTTS
jgi:hypothetical protein